MDLKTNEPFWLVKTGLMQSYPSLRSNLECDVLIVGGGITGSLIAHQCIKDGYKTVLIDKREIANGSTSATTSMLQYEIDKSLSELKQLIGEKGAIASYKACFKAIDELEDICNEIKSKAGFTRKKSLYFSAYKKDLIELKHEFEVRKKAGFKVRWMEADTIFEKYEIANTYGGILSDQGASLEAFMFTHELLAYNIKKGLQVFDKTELIKVEHHKLYNKVSLNTGANIKTKKIIYCVGYESAQMISENFVKLISTYAIVSEQIPKLKPLHKKLLVWNTAQPYIYLRTTDDNRFLIGGEDETFQNPQKRNALLNKKKQKLLKSFEKHLPHVPFYPDFVWAGTFGETKDGLPYIGEHKDFKNSYFVLGFGGNGITFSVTGMEMVADWLKNKKHILSPYFAFGR